MTNLTLCHLKKCIALFRVCIKGSLSTSVLCASFVFIRDKPSWCEAKMISDTTKFKLRKYVWDVGPILAYKECKSKKREKEKFSSENKRYDRRDVQDTFIKDSWCSNEASSNRSEGLSLLRLLHLIIFFDKFFLHHSPLVRHVRKFGFVSRMYRGFFSFRRTDTPLYGRKNGPSHESFKSLVSRKRHRKLTSLFIVQIKDLINLEILLSNLRCPGDKYKPRNTMIDMIGASAFKTSDQIFL